MKKKKVAAQSAVVGIEGATVYVSPDFDSQVLAALPPGLKIQASRKMFPGRGGLGLFYRVRYDKRNHGYIADTELIPEFKKKGKRPTKNPVYEDVEEMRERALNKMEPIYFTRFFGVVGGVANYSEKFGGKTFRSQELMYGLRFTGPGVLSEVLPVDLFFLFSFKAPKYYDSFSTPGTKTSGFFGLLDLSLLLPLMEENHLTLYGGLGLLVTYAKFKVPIANEFLDSQEVRLGGALTAGMGIRVAKWILRGDAKYYYEATSYLGFWGTLQREF